MKKPLSCRMLSLPHQGEPDEYIKGPISLVIFCINFCGFVVGKGETVGSTGVLWFIRAEWVVPTAHCTGECSRSAELGANFVPFT